MDDFAKKALWVVLPIAIATGITLVPGPAAEVQFIAYALLVLIAMAGIWATNAKKHRIEREEAEAKRERERDQAEQKRWDDLNARLDSIDERLDRSEETDRAMLRSDLVRGHREWVEEKGYITLEALEVLSKTHEAYNKVGGNDTGDKLWQDINALPIDEKR